MKILNIKLFLALNFSSHTADSGWILTQNNGNYNEIKGNLKSFKGEEKILYNNKLVYTLTYHGGFIQKIWVMQ